MQSVLPSWSPSRCFGTTGPKRNMTNTRENIQTDARPRLNEPDVLSRLARHFTAETLNILAKPDHPGLMARLDFECRLGIRTAYIQFASRIPDDEVEK
jgi:hypothetical protein